MAADLLVRLGDRIRNLRKARGWTQTVMAERVGIDRSFLADVERGKRNVSILNLEPIAKGFKVSLSRLFRGCEEFALMSCPSRCTRTPIALGQPVESTTENVSLRAQQRTWNRRALQDP
jgi:transcriptional regulator with XRE-family HTH domain